MVRPLNVLVINWQDISNPLSGGAEVHLHEIFKRLAQTGHHVSLLCSDYPKARASEIIDDIRIIRQGQRNTFNFIVPSAYKKLSRQLKLDVVIDDVNKIPFYTPLYVRQPVIAIFHHLFGKSIFLETRLPAASYVSFSECLVPLIYHRVAAACVSPSTQTELKRYGLKGPMKLVYNGVDLDTFGTGKYLQSKKPLIGYLGRIKKYKCIEHFLQAIPLVCEQVPELGVFIIGEGDHRPHLERLTARLGLENRVVFTGAISTEDKIKRLNEIWLGVNPSPKEGWGLTVIEANACGTPVVAANSPGLRDSVLHQRTGWLYPYGDIPALAKAIVRIITDTSLRQRLAAGAIAWAKNFSWEQSAQTMDDFIREVIDQ